MHFDRLFLFATHAEQSNGASFRKVTSMLEYIEFAMSYLELGCGINTVLSNLSEETMTRSRFADSYGMVVHSDICDDCIHHSKLSALWQCCLWLQVTCDLKIIGRTRVQCLDG